LMGKTKNGFRFTPAIYTYAYNIRFKGGEGVLNDIRGKSRGTGNAIDIYDLNIPLPSVNSLLNHSYPINYDPNPDNFNTRRILDGIPKETKKNSLFLLAADEISIQPQLVHINNYGLVGLVVDCYEKNISAFVELHKEDQIYKKLATEVMQIMLISIDGKCATPLSFIYTRKANQKVTKDYFIQLIKLLEREGINVIGGTTDGYLDTSFQGSMNKKYKEYLHFYDFIHLLKRFRNCLTKKHLYFNSRGSIYKFSDVANVILKYEPFIKDVGGTNEAKKVIHYTDIMDLAPVINLMKGAEALLKYKNPKSPELKQKVSFFANYLLNMKKIYDIFNSGKLLNLTGLEAGVEKLLSSSKYFSNLYYANKRKKRKI